RTVRQLSTHTLDNYGRDLRAVTTLLEERGLKNWPAVTAQDIRTVVATLHRRGLGGKSLQRLLSSVRGLFGYLLQDCTARDNPALGISAPKSPRRLPHTLDPDAVN